MRIFAILITMLLSTEGRSETTLSSFCSKDDFPEMIKISSFQELPIDELNPLQCESHASSLQTTHSIRSTQLALLKRESELTTPNIEPLFRELLENVASKKGRPITYEDTESDVGRLIYDCRDAIGVGKGQLLDLCGWLKGKRLLQSSTVQRAQAIYEIAKTRILENKKMRPPTNVGESEKFNSRLTPEVVTCLISNETRNSFSPAVISLNTCDVSLQPKSDGGRGALTMQIGFAQMKPGSFADATVGIDPKIIKGPQNSPSYMRDVIQTYFQIPPLTRQNRKTDARLTEPIKNLNPPPLRLTGLPPTVLYRKWKDGEKNVKPYKIEELSAVELYDAITMYPDLQIEAILRLLQNNFSEETGSEAALRSALARYNGSMAKTKCKSFRFHKDLYAAYIMKCVSCLKKTVSEGQPNWANEKSIMACLQHSSSRCP